MSVRRVRVFLLTILVAVLGTALVSAAHITFAEFLGRQP